MAIWIETGVNPNFSDYVGYSKKAMKVFGDSTDKLYDVVASTRKEIFAKLANHVEPIQDGEDDPKNTIYRVQVPNTAFYAVSHMQMMYDRLVVFVGIVHRDEVAGFKLDCKNQVIPHLH
jgi:hypothetical protein